MEQVTCIPYSISPPPPIEVFQFLKAYSSTTLQFPKNLTKIWQISNNNITQLPKVWKQFANNLKWIWLYLFNNFPTIRSQYYNNLPIINHQSWNILKQFFNDFPTIFQPFSISNNMLKIYWKFANKMTTICQQFVKTSWGWAVSSSEMFKWL